jgi:hypothetical protein
VQAWKKRGFLIPCYLVRRKTNTTVIETVSACPVFSEDGEVTGIRWSPVPGPLYVSPVRYYREKGLLIEDPAALDLSSSEYCSSEPLYTFWQLHPAMEIYRRSHRTINILFESPERYKAWRTVQVRGLKAFLKRIGRPQFYGPGAPQKHFSEKARTASIKMSNQKSKQAQRVRESLQALQEEFLKAEKRLIQQDRGDNKTLQKAADLILEKEQSKRGKIRAQACDDFAAWVSDRLRGKRRANVRKNPP